jgi:aspartyl-tRNA(Asn)/glutamyl-tRNA(Gln) amidotransferase subunit A
MTEADGPIAGSIAGGSFDDALAVLRRQEPLPPARRVPYDYSVPSVAARNGAVGSSGAGPLLDAVGALATGATTSRALVEAALAAARAHANRNGVAELDAAGALDAADAADAALAAGAPTGPLHGIPVTVKDVIDVAGLPTRAGSVAYLDHPRTDAVSVARLRAAGAIVVGKATTHEFALGVTSPQSRNPHDATRIPGGSSGGSAVCVASGIGLASLGTDTRASIRVPAALSGVVGFKPTYGRIPTMGVVALSWTMDHVAPMAATVTDAAFVLDVLLGSGSALAATPPAPAGTRIGVAAACFADAEPGVVAAVESAVEALVIGGMVIDTAKRPNSDDLALANAAGLVVSRCEAAAFHRSLDLDRTLYWQEVAEQLELAAAIAAIDYLDAQRARARLADELLSCFEHVDVLAMPTVPVVAPPVSDFAAYLMVLARNAIPWSLVGFPAISLPCGPPGALPVGLQLVALPGREDLLVAVGKVAEARIA